MHLLSPGSNDRIPFFSSDRPKDDIHLLKRDSLGLGDVEISENGGDNVDGREEEELGVSGVAGGPLDVDLRFLLCSA